MNLWLRLLWLLATAKFRSRLSLPTDASRLTFRVWPHDLDLAGHMNNGRYLSIMDLGRLDVMLRSGLWREALRQRWTPIASGISIRFSRELRPFQPFRLETRLLCWDTTLVVMEQSFFIIGGPRNGQIAARALFKGGLYNRTERKFVTIAELMQRLGISAVSPPPSDDVAAFLRADDEMKRSGVQRAS